MSSEITKNTTLAEILKQKGTEDVLSKYGLPCLHCPMANYEMEHLKIGDTAKMYGIDINSLLKELNKIKERKK